MINSFVSPRVFNNENWMPDFPCFDLFYITWILSKKKTKTSINIVFVTLLKQTNNKKKKSDDMHRNKERKMWNCVYLHRTLKKMLFF